MTPDIEQKVRQALWLEAADQYPPYVNLVESELLKIEPSLHRCEKGFGVVEVSGCQWAFHVDSFGNGCGPMGGAWPAQALKAWQLAISYRAPLITALSWSVEGETNDLPVDPALATLTQRLANQCGLNYIDASDLIALEIPWDDLQGDAWRRLDWSDPNAFNLLFYEY